MQERVRAIIIEDGKLLTIKRVKENETYWVFPGGGIEDGENQRQALIRECQEELGVVVEVGELVFENSYVHWKFGPQHEYFYNCSIISGEVGTGEGPEFQENSSYEGTHEVEWIEISGIDKLDLQPNGIKKLFNIA